MKSLGAREVAASPGGVGFRGPFELCYRANLHSRIASRILWCVGEAPYRTEDHLYKTAHDLAWPDWFSSRCTIKVKVSARDCPLRSLEFITLRIKDALCDAFRARGHRRPDVDTQHPDIRIDVFLDARRAFFYLDTSGESLFKRGWRTAAGNAPIRENLAAGILALTGWNPTVPFLDPMCGAGTFLVEAAQIARGMAPGLGRRFAFERLHRFEQASWTELCQQALAARRPDLAFRIFGSDREAAALEQTRANLSAAGLPETVSLQQTDILLSTPPSEPGIMVMNPPYGVRMAVEDDLVAFYPKLGNVLKQRYAGWTAFILTADSRLSELIRLVPSRRIPLYNGPLECRLYEFKLLHGPARRALRSKNAAAHPFSRLH